MKTVVAEGKYLRFIDVDGWEYMDRINCEDAAIIIPITDDGKLVLIEQKRRPFDQPVIEFPAGLINDLPDCEENDEDAAHRELIEETGYEAGQLDRVCYGPVSAGISSEQASIFKASKLSKVGPGGGDASEDIRVHEIPLTELDAWLDTQEAEGKYIDIKVRLLMLNLKP